MYYNLLVRAPHSTVRSASTVYHGPLLMITLVNIPYLELDGLVLEHGVISHLEPELLLPHRVQSLFTHACFLLGT